MLVRQEIEALRGDVAPQRLMQAKLQEAVDRWRLSSGIAEIECEMARFAKGEALTKLPLLAALFEPDHPSAHMLVDRFFGELADELRDSPLGQLPLRGSSDGTVTNLIIARVGPVVLLAQSIDGNGLRWREPPQTVSFVPSETWEHVLAGTAEAELLRIASARPAAVEFGRLPCSLVPGTINFRDGACESLLLKSVPANIVTLKLQRRLATGAVTREFRLKDGVQVHQAAGSSRESRLELATALLGRMGRSDAAPLLAAMAEEQGGNSLRWQSLRECLGLDTALGFSVLCRISSRSDDPLAAPAGALRAQLLESYPQLKELAQCLV